MVLRGVEFVKSSGCSYVPKDTGERLQATWTDMLNSPDFKGLVAVVQTDANIDKLLPCEITVTVTEVADKSNYYEMKELAEVYTEEDKRKYYAIENRAK